jgi:multidrug efflux pump subunit AcrA (membrane-fusion protein)
MTQDERINAISVNPHMATIDDIADLAATVQEQRERIAELEAALKRQEIELRECEALWKAQKTIKESR